MLAVVTMLALVTMHGVGQSIHHVPSPITGHHVAPVSNDAAPPTSVPASCATPVCAVAVVGLLATTFVAGRASQRTAPLADRRPQSHSEAPEPPVPRLTLAF